VHNKTKLNWNLVVLNNYFILVMLGILQTIVAKRVTCRGAQYWFHAECQFYLVRC